MGWADLDNYVVQLLANHTDQLITMVARSGKVGSVADRSSQSNFLGRIVRVRALPSCPLLTYRTRWANIMQRHAREQCSLNILAVTVRSHFRGITTVFLRACRHLMRISFLFLADRKFRLCTFDIPRRMLETPGRSRPLHPAVCGGGLSAVCLDLKILERLSSKRKLVRSPGLAVPLAADRRSGMCRIPYMDMALHVSSPPALGITSALGFPSSQLLAPQKPYGHISSALLAPQNIQTEISVVPSAVLSSHSELLKTPEKVGSSESDAL